MRASWSRFSSGHLPPDEFETRCQQLLQQIAECEVANRPGRVEPRELKRPRHRYKLRQQARSILENNGSTTDNTARKYTNDSAIRS